MGKTCENTQNEKQKRYINKIKSDQKKLKNLRDKAAERMRKRRLELPKNKKVREEKQEKERARMKAYRQKKKSEAQQEEDHEAYSCRQTLGKAMKKAERALPSNLKKKIEVIQGLVKKYVQPENDQNKTSTQVDLEWERKLKMVKDIYLSDDISVQSAAKRDTLVVDGQIVAKRYMLLTVSEAYEVYKNESLEECVSKTKFFKYRPKHVQLSTKMPHNMCVCIHHANFGFLLKGGATVIHSFPKTFESFLELACCNIKNESCMNNACENCTKDVKTIIPVIYLTKMDEIVKWQHWRKVDDRITLTYSVASLSDLLHELEVQLPLFKRHFFVKRDQQNYFEAKRKNIKPGELVLQIDFAENNRLVCQNEVQSAHFSYKQVSIFTCVAWMLDKTVSFAVISDSLSHSKIDVYVFITKIVEEIINQYGTFQNISIFSDGSSCQFKNKFIFWSLPDLMAKFGFRTLDWNFFATSHGKGAVDGVGAIVKRKVFQITKTKNIVLNDAMAFYNCAHDHITGINIIYIGAGVINEISPILLEKWNDVPNIPGIRTIHSIFCDQDFKLSTALTAYSTKTKLS